MCTLCGPFTAEPTGFGSHTGNECPGLFYFCGSGMKERVTFCSPGWPRTLDNPQFQCWGKVVCHASSLASAPSQADRPDVPCSSSCPPFIPSPETPAFEVSPRSQMEKPRLVTGASYAEVNPKCLSLVSRRYFPEPFYFLCKGAFLASSPPATSKPLS